MYDGHHLIKMAHGVWVFDVTEFIGYKVKADKKGHVKSFEKAFIVDSKNDYEVVKIINVPVKIIREVRKYIDDYKKEALIND